MRATSRRRRAAAVVLAAAAAVVAACGGPAQGDVIGKHHEDAYSTTTLVSTGKTFIPITTYHDEAWYLTLRDCDVPRGEDCEQGDVKVSEDVYDATAVGDFYEVP